MAGGRAPTDTGDAGLALVDVAGPDDPRLAAFHAGIYLDAFAAQREPLATWRAALGGALPYAMGARLALGPAGDVRGGVTFEHYPRSGCGLVTYLVVAPGARGRGLGKVLLDGAVAALAARGAPLVLGEVNDPAVHGPAAWPRLRRFLRWGARVLDARYVQPALGPGLARDRGLVLIALAGPGGLPSAVPGARVRAFVEELYAVTEGGPPDPAVALPDEIRLVARVQD